MWRGRVDGSGLVCRCRVGGVRRVVSWCLVGSGWGGVCLRGGDYCEVVVAFVVEYTLNVGDSSGRGCEPTEVHI